MIKRLKKPVPLHRLTDKAKRNDTTRYQIMPMTKDMLETPPVIEGKEFTYGKSGSFMTDDKGVADEIVAKYGKHEVEVWDVNHTWHPSDDGHKYRFSNVDLPWKKNNPHYDEYGKRIDDIIQHNNDKESEVTKKEGG